MAMISIETSYGTVEVTVVDKCGAITVPLLWGDTAQDPALGAVVSLILAHACEGVDVGSAEYARGINVALDAITKED